MTGRCNHDKISLCTMSRHHTRIDWLRRDVKLYTTLSRTLIDNQSEPLCAIVRDEEKLYKDMTESIKNLI